MLSTEQLAMRHTGIGGSEIAVIAGLSPGHRSSPMQVYLRKTGGTVEDPDPEQQFAMDRGSLVEAAIANYVARTRGWTLEERGTVRHRDFEWAYATPDRIIAGVPEIIEIKDVGIHTMRAGWWQDGPPDHVQAQVQWQLAVLRCRKAYVAASIAGATPEVWEIPGDTEIQAELLRIGQEFWENHVVPRVPPPIDASADSTEYLCKRFAKNNGLMVPCAEARELAEQYKAVSAEVQAAQSRKDLAGNRLRELIADHDGVMFEGGKATWKVNGSAGTDWKTLALSLHPTEAQIAAHERARARVLRVTLKETS